MRRFSFLIYPALILLVLVGRYAFTARTAQSGIYVLLPVSVREIEKDGFSSFVRLRYDKFIPVGELADENGTVVIKRQSDGRVEFVADFQDVPLRPREMLLKYTVVPRSVFAGKEQAPNVRFTSVLFRFSPRWTFQPSAVKYGVVRVDHSGNAVLTGLADISGTVLANGL